MFPSERFTITTYLSPDEVQKKLIEVVEATTNPIQSRWNRPQKPYKGQIGEHSFQISRLVPSRNAFFPQIEGRIQAQGRVSQIEIEIKMPRTAITVTYLVLGIYIVGSLGFLGFALSQKKFELEYLIPVVTVIGGLVSPRLSVYMEAKRSKKFFKELFQAQEENSI